MNKEKYIRKVNESYNSLYAFYKGLGYSDMQCGKLSKYIFTEEIETKIPDCYKYTPRRAGMTRSLTFAGGMCASGGMPALNPNLFEVDESVDFSCNDGLSLSENKNPISIMSMCYSDCINTESYESFVDNEFKKVLTNPSSTFSSTANTASYNIIKRAVRMHETIRHDMVRTEEILNYFDYKLKAPRKRIFNINTEFSDIPNSMNKLMFVGLKGKDVVVPRQNIVFLVDVSGSMLYNQILKVQKSMMTILKQLNKNDIVSLVTYSDNDFVIFSGLKAEETDKIIDCMTSKGVLGGCTYGSKGIEMAYDIAEQYYLDEGSNRVMLFTDGDFNFGICDKLELNTFIREKKDSNVFLTCLGYGYSNYKDDTLETLSKNGNGNYFYIDTDEDILEVLQRKINSNLITIAKDVKIQVEFNPKYIESYRLVGYENRQLKHEDFKNDSVIAEPVGSGHTVVALYELVPNISYMKGLDTPYRYIQVGDKNDVCTVSVRYKLPDSDVSDELSVILSTKDFDNPEMSYNLQLTYCIMKYAELLRKSTNFTKGDGSTLVDIINKLLIIQDNKKIKEFLELVQNI